MAEKIVDYPVDPPDEIGTGLPGTGETSGTDSASAQFLLQEDGTAALLRWPRTSCQAVIPSRVAGHMVTRIGALAFAPMQLAQTAGWTDFLTSPISFSIFCMKNMRHIRYGQAGDGPREILLPESVAEIDRFAFWRCTRLQRIQLPSGVRQLGAGVFGDCTELRQVILPSSLEQIGEFPPEACQVMPDIGTFTGCANLRKLTVPASLRLIGAHAFNSSGLKTLTAEDNSSGPWSRPVSVHTTAFDHTASLCWLEKSIPGGNVIWRAGLPPGRDKILRSDPQNGFIRDLPHLFFRSTPDIFDQLALNSGRLDFEGRMAIARLSCPSLLLPETATAYLDILAEHYASLPLFWPDDRQPWHAAFALMAKSDYFTAEHLNLLLRQAGKLYLPPDLIDAMIEERNQRFHVITGFEDLEL